MPRGAHPVHPSLNALMALEGVVGRLSFAARQPLGSVLAGRHGSRLRGRGLDFSELRRYVAGDDLRQLDARASLRFGKPYVRSYTEERDRPAFVIVDQRMSMYFGSVRYFKCAVAARLAALAAWMAYRGGDRVGGMVLDEGGGQAVKPARSRDRVRQLLAAVTQANASLAADRLAGAGNGVLNTALTGVLGHAPHDCLVCIISDFAGADDETLRLLRLLAAHNDVVGAFVYDPMAENVPQHGRLVVTQGKLQLEIAAGRRRERQMVADFYGTRLRQVVDLLHRSRVPVLAFDTVEDELPQLRRELGRQHGGRRV